LWRRFNLFGLAGQRKEQIQKANHFVPEELIHRISASGTPEEARRRWRNKETRLHLSDPVSLWAAM
jgi:hypothetical protein